MSFTRCCVPETSPRDLHRSHLETIRCDEQLNAVEEARFPVGALAAGWVFLVIGGSVLSRAESESLNLLGMALSFPSFLFFVPVQRYINRVNARINPRMPYTPWTVGHIVCLIVGILLWFVILAGLLLPAQAAQ